MFSPLGKLCGCYTTLRGFSYVRKHSGSFQPITPVIINRILSTWSPYIWNHLNVCMKSIYNQPFKKTIPLLKVSSHSKIVNQMPPTLIDNIKIYHGKVSICYSYLSFNYRNSNFHFMKCSFEFTSYPLMRNSNIWSSYIPMNPPHITDSHFPVTE